MIPSPEAEIQDCCNGLLLFASSNRSRYHVVNPLTSQRFDIPVVNPVTCTRSSLVFDPSVFVDESKDPYFKIVSFKETVVRNLTEVNIYSSDKDEWCTSLVHILEPHQIYGRFVYFNRDLYFLSVDMYLVCIENMIVSSDLRARAIALPDKGEKLSHLGCIGNCYGRLCYSNLDVQGTFISVWELEDSDSEWRLMHRISISEDIGHCKALGNLALKRVGEQHVKSVKESNKLLRPCAILPNDDDDGARVTLYLDDFLSYDVETKITHVLGPRKKLKQDGNLFFPFSSCPLLLPSRR